MSSKKKADAPPPYIAKTLPSDAGIWKTFKNSICGLKAGTVIVRAAWNRKSVWPDQVGRTYRFGPPASLVNASGNFDFHWTYLGQNAITAVWEAKLCVNDISTRTFFFERGASEAFIARMKFGRDIQLLDLTGDAVSKLGIYEELVNQDHEWCQWFGCALDRLIAKHTHLDGIRYMSRKHPGHYAYAISSRAMDGLDAYRQTSIERFEDTVEYFQLRRDSCFAKS